MKKILFILFGLTPISLTFGSTASITDTDVTASVCCHSRFPSLSTHSNKTVTATLSGKAFWSAEELLNAFSARLGQSLTSQRLSVNRRMVDDPTELFGVKYLQSASIVLLLHSKPTAPATAPAFVPPTAPLFIADSKKLTGVLFVGVDTQMLRDIGLVPKCWDPTYKGNFDGTYFISKVPTNTAISQNIPLFLLDNVPDAFTLCQRVLSSCDMGNALTSTLPLTVQQDGKLLGPNDKIEDPKVNFVLLYPPQLTMAEREMIKKHLNQVDKSADN